MDIDVKTSISKQEFGIQNTHKKKDGNRYKLKVVSEDKVYLETYYNHQPRSVIMDEIIEKIKAHELQIVGWMLIEDQQLMKFNLGTDVEPQLVKINAQLEISKVLELEQLLKEFKDVFTWTYNDLKGISLELAQHIIELDTIISSTHHVSYKLNINNSQT